MAKLGKQLMENSARGADRLEEFNAQIRAGVRLSTSQTFEQEHLLIDHPLPKKEGAWQRFKNRIGWGSRGGPESIG